MRIRLASAADLPAILEIANWAAVHTPANFALAPEPLAQWQATYAQTSATHPWLVAERDGVVLGFAKAGPHRARAAYAFTAEMTVYIGSEHHRQGIGKALYGRLIPTLRAQNYALLLAGITSPHPPSEALHAAFGFVKCGAYHRVGWKFGRWHDVGYWELHLVDADAAPLPLKTVNEVWK